MLTAYPKKARRFGTETPTTPRPRFTAEPSRGIRIPNMGTDTMFGSDIEPGTLFHRRVVAGAL